jgi:ribosomal protein L29
MSDSKSRPCAIVMPKAAKPSELKAKSRADLLEEVATLEKKLFELRGQAGSRLT